VLYSFCLVTRRASRPEAACERKNAWRREGTSSMVQFVWEFVVHEGAQGPFELAYGPGGAWSQLFAPAPGFRGITLLRDTDDPRRYLAIEVWDAAAQREQALAQRADAYAALEASLAGWAASAREVGAFRVRAEATVRPGRRGRLRR
jgi:heme-degrading monooxygenase HmoA